MGAQSVRAFGGEQGGGVSADPPLTPANPAVPDLPKQPFIRATEIWVPSGNGRQLELASGLYGPLAQFEAVSRQTRFDHNEGLPGKAWAAGYPIVLKDLTHSYFKRGAAASAVGLTCALAVPIFAGEILNAVIVLFCGDDREHVGAIELWHSPPDSAEMGLVDGYYGTAEVFEWQSRHVKFTRGSGLPGQVWDTGMPAIMEDLGRSRRFLRWEDARRTGINRGVGIPCGRDGAGSWVLTFLSALGTPIARRFEAWVPDTERGVLMFYGGYCEHGADLAATYAGASVPRGAGTLGLVWCSGRPAIATDLSGEPDIIGASTGAAGLTTMVCLPVFAEGAPRALVAWYL
ncbi:MAG: GAF domain-containing protein [Rhodospirillales bacterium]|nr:GAF domain-containing protein [Rhodospirillales bacterium]